MLAGLWWWLLGRGLLGEYNVLFAGWVAGGLPGSAAGVCLDLPVRAFSGFRLACRGVGDPT